MNPLPSDEAIRDKVYEVVARHAKLDSGILRPGSTLKDLGIASLAAIEALFDIEEEFDIDFPDRGPNFDGDTLQHLVDTVRAGLNAKAAKTRGAA